VKIVPDGQIKVNRHQQQNYIEGKVRIFIDNFKLSAARGI